MLRQTRSYLFLLTPEIYAIDHTELQWKSVSKNESEIETDSDLENKRQPLNDNVVG